ncbi:Lon protease [Abditibacteriota bacterium]|nr:Lon protease [Abditibacteriota bacterium]
MPFELPIFPLSVVLFPGMPLPLHIFESRYRLMIGRALQGDKTFGVAQVVEGQEGTSGTWPATVGTTAEILEVTPFADGRMNVQTIGVRRFRILSVREEDEYIVAQCEWLDDDDARDGLIRLAMATRRALSRYFDALALNSDSSNDGADLDVPQDPQSLSMFIAAILQLPLQQKQELLEMTDTRARLEIEDFLLQRATIIQLAFAKRTANGEATTTGDTSLGPMSGFVSLN